MNVAADALRAILQDAGARLGRILEAIADGEYELAFQIAEDLEHDLARGAGGASTWKAA